MKKRTRSGPLKDLLVSSEIKSQFKTTRGEIGPWFYPRGRLSPHIRGGKCSAVQTVEALVVLNF